MTIVNQSARTVSDDGQIIGPWSSTSEHDPSTFLTSDEVAQMIRVPTATLRYWRHIGVGPKSFKMGPRRVLYLHEDVVAWVDSPYQRGVQAG